MPVTSGASIGPYKVDREIGRGGMGVVFLAHDTRLGRTVALKALPEDVASDADRLQRFEREARVLAPLNHPEVAGARGFSHIVIADPLLADASALTDPNFARDAPGRDPRHRGVSLSRAGAGEGGRSPHRHLVLRLHRLRMPYGPPRVRGGDGE